MPTGSIALALLLALGVSVSGCASGSTLDTDRRERDASAPAEDPLVGDDAGVADAAAFDAGPEDAATAPMDAGVDARVCVAETCDGTDEDCDDRIDEGATCPCEQLSWEGRSYLFCDAERSWPGARMHCESTGYSLAVIDDASEDSFVFAAVLAREWGDTWLGHNDLVDEGVWSWLDGEAMRYVNWDVGEPNDGGDRGEDCGVVMTADGRESYWDDRPCDGERTYVCETR